MTRFDGFVLLAEMRTGSNFLEETLNLFPGLHCYGEAFNPAFVGHHDQQALFGMSRRERDADPLELMRRIFEGADGLGGFRFFHDHAPRVLRAAVPDPRIAKVVLTRNPLDSYVSRKIADATGQWRLTDKRHRKTAKVRFDPAEFRSYLSDLRTYQDGLSRQLQTSGQVAFRITYEQVSDIEVVNGLARFLGIEHRLPAVSNRLKRQNPAHLRDKVENFEQMQEAVATIDLGCPDPQRATPAPKPRLTIRSFVAAERDPLLLMPIKGGPNDTVENWLAALSETVPDALPRDFCAKTFRQWRNHNKRARTFTIVSHPMDRAYNVFERHILLPGPQRFTAIRNWFRQSGALQIPQGTGDETWPVEQRRDAFLGFLRFLKNNLAGQTPVRTDAAFASQAALLQRCAEVATPDMVIRADQLSLGLRQLARQVGRMETPEPLPAFAAARQRLAEIHDDEIEAAARAAYNRDFTAFGFRRWTP